MDRRELDARIRTLQRRVCALMDLEADLRQRCAQVKRGSLAFTANWDQLIAARQSLSAAVAEVRTSYREQQTALGKSRPRGGWAGQGWG